MGLNQFFQKLFGSDDVSEEDKQAVADHLKATGLDSQIDVMPKYAPAPVSAPAVPAVAPSPSGPVYKPAPAPPVVNPDLPPAGAGQTVDQRPIARPVDEPQLANASAGPVYQPAAMSAGAQPTATGDNTPIMDFGGPQITYGPKGQVLGVGGGGDAPQRQQALLDAYERYQPTDHNGRLKSGAIGFGKAYMRGGGIVGGVTGLVRGLVDPGADEREANETAIAKTGRAVAQQQASRKAASDLANAETDRTYKNAESERILHPVYAPHDVETDDGVMSVSGTKATPITNVVTGEPISKAEKAKEKTITRHDANGKAELWTADASGKPVKLIGPGDPADDLVRVNGKLVHQRDALNYEGQIGQRTATKARQARQDARQAAQDALHVQERTEDKSEAGLTKNEQRRQKGGELAGQLEEAKQAAVTADGAAGSVRKQLANTTDKAAQGELNDRIQYYENEKKKALDKAQGIMTTIKSNHSDLYETGVGDGGFPYVKVKPFSVSALKNSVPNITKARIAAAVQAAQDRGQEIVD